MSLKRISIFISLNETEYKPVDVLRTEHNRRPVDIFRDGIEANLQKLGLNKEGLKEVTIDDKI